MAMTQIESGAKPAWTRGELALPKSLLERIEEEARAAYARDEEACGFIVGPADAPLLLDEVVSMENRANKLHKLDPETYPRTGRMYFDLDPLKFDKRVREGAANGRPVKVLYHSHLDVGAYFSDTDAAAAKMGGERPAYDLAYLVTSIRKGTVDDHKLFVWEPGKSGGNAASGVASGAASGAPSDAISNASGAFVESRFFVKD
jgi:proteasome lid subunit RPN8/RPN11